MSTNLFCKTSIVDFPLGPLGPSEFSYQIYITEVFPHVAVLKSKKKEIAYHPITHTPMAPRDSDLLTLHLGFIAVLSLHRLYGNF